MNNKFLRASLMTGNDVDTLLCQYFIPEKFTGEDELEYLNFRKNWCQFHHHFTSTFLFESDLCRFSLITVWL